jgi:hypothetical protein
VPVTLLDDLREDHARIGSLLDQVHLEAAEQRGPGCLQQVLDLLVRHETAEAALVRPRTRQTRGGDAVADCLDRQERRICHLVTALRRAATEGPPPADPVEQLRQTVLQHLDTEEDLEHTRLEAELSVSALGDLGRRYRRIMELDLTELEAASEGARFPREQDLADRGLLG